MTLNPYYPQSKMAAIAFFFIIQFLLFGLIVLIYKRFLELEQ